jgi:hypothetical protein
LDCANTPLVEHNNNNINFIFIVLFDLVLENIFPFNSILDAVGRISACYNTFPRVSFQAKGIIIDAISANIFTLFFKLFDYECTQSLTM